MKENYATNSTKIYSERKRETGEKMRGNEKETHGFSFLIMTGEKKRESEKQKKEQRKRKMK